MAHQNSSGKYFFVMGIPRSHMLDQARFEGRPVYCADDDGGRMIFEYQANNGLIYKCMFDYNHSDLRAIDFSNPTSGSATITTQSNPTFSAASLSAAYASLISPSLTPVIAGDSITPAKPKEERKPKFKVGDTVLICKTKEEAEAACKKQGIGWDDDGNDDIRIALIQSGQTYQIVSADGSDFTYTLGDGQEEIKFNEDDDMWWPESVLKKSKPIPPKPLTLDDVILPDTIKKDIIAVVNQARNKGKIFDEWGLGEVIEYGRGSTLLFHGKSGTGKTLIARKIAKALRKTLKELTTAELESSEPGQYERNLKAHFEAAGKDGVIFLDECDALIQSRQGMGQILSGQNNFLLKCIEGFEGILILATNRIDSLDAALERRISLTVEFPTPDFEARKLIWKAHLPAKLPLEEVITIDDLAKFELTGGQIKNAVLNAARFAVAEEAIMVLEDHFKRAIIRIIEAQKNFGAPRATGNVQGNYIVKG